jgi:hypothetical protein
MRKPVDASNPAAAQDVIQESRRHTRVYCTEGTHFMSKTRLYEGTIKNVSQGGTYIETDGFFTVGQEITVAGTFDRSGRETKQLGAIVRKDARGIGVKFKRPRR